MEQPVRISHTLQEWPTILLKYLDGWSCPYDTVSWGKCGESVCNKSFCAKMFYRFYLSQTRCSSCNKIKYTRNYFKWFFFTLYIHNNRTNLSSRPHQSLLALAGQTDASIIMSRTEEGYQMENRSTWSHLSWLWCFCWLSLFPCRLM